MGLKNAKDVPALWQYRAMHPVGIRQEIIDRVIARRGRLRWFDRLEPAKTGLETAAEDLVLAKNRYSALVPGSSTLERVLRSLGMDTVLIAGTKTNVCCESTARDAMMLDFKVVLVADCCAALSDEEHRATLETHIQ